MMAHRTAAQPPHSVNYDDVEDSDEQPFEFEVEKQLSGAKRSAGAAAAGSAQRQCVLTETFAKKPKPAKAEPSDDDSDEEFAAGMFGGDSKQKATFTSAFESKGAKKEAERKVVKGKRWQNGKVPNGWEARCYTRGNGEYWIFSHPMHGEVQSFDACCKKANELRQEGKGKAKAAGASSAAAGKGAAGASAAKPFGALGGFQRKKRDGGGPAEDPDDDVEEDGEAAEEAEAEPPRPAAGDDLAALLAGRKAKEAETEAMRKRVEEEVEEDYTTGLVVNYDLAKAVGGRRRSI